MTSNGGSELMTLFHKLQVQVLHYANYFHINEKKPSTNKPDLCLPMPTMGQVLCPRLRNLFCSATLHKHALNAGVFLWSRGSSRICAIWFLVHNFYSKNVWTKNPRFCGFQSPSSWKQTFDFLRGRCALSPTYQQKLQLSQVNFQAGTCQWKRHTMDSASSGIHGYLKRCPCWNLELPYEVQTSIRNLNCSKLNSARFEWYGLMHFNGK